MPYDKDSIINKLETQRKGGAEGPFGLKNNSSLEQKSGHYGAPKNSAAPSLPQKDDSIFGGKSQISRLEMKKILRTFNPKDYGLTKMKRYQLSELEKLFPERFGGFIDRAEAEASVKKMYWDIQHMARDAKNFREVAVEKKKLGFLKKIIRPSAPAPNRSVVSSNINRPPAAEFSPVQPEIKPLHAKDLPMPHTVKPEVTFESRSLANKEIKEVPREPILQEIVPGTKSLAKITPKITPEIKPENMPSVNREMREIPNMMPLPEALKQIKKAPAIITTENRREEKSVDMAKRESGIKKVFKKLFFIPETYQEKKSAASVEDGELALKAAKIPDTQPITQSVDHQSKPKITIYDLPFMEVLGIETILDIARQHSLLHAPKTLSPEETLQYEKIELEKLFPNYFGGVADKETIEKMANELSWKIKNMEKNPTHWDNVDKEKNKLAFLQDVIGQSNGSSNNAPSV